MLQSHYFILYIINMMRWNNVKSLSWQQGAFRELKPHARLPCSSSELRLTCDGVFLNESFCYKRSNRFRSHCLLGFLSALCLIFCILGFRVLSDGSTRRRLHHSRGSGTYILLYVQLPITFFAFSQSNIKSELFTLNFQFY